MEVTSLKYRANITELMLRIFKTEANGLKLPNLCLLVSTKVSKLGNVEFLFCSEASKHYLNYTEMVLFGD